MAGLSEVPVIIIDADDRKAAELSLIENLQRENLNPLEEAEAYKALIDEYDLTQEEVSSRIGKSRSAIANTMRLLNLPEDVLQLVKDRSISAGHAKAMLKLTDPALIRMVAAKTIAKKLSVRQVEALVDSLCKPKKAKEDNPDKIEVNYIADLEKRVTNELGKLFKIHSNGKRKKIEIEYSDDRDLENIIKKLCGNTFFEE